MSQTDDEIVQLRHANTATLYTLWLATILGALIGGSISVLLARRVTKSIDLVAERANAIAAGDLTGGLLNVQSRDQIGTLAQAMQQMQTNLAGIIGTVVNTAGSLTGSAASMRSASDQMHRRIDQQSQQTQQAATAMQEMSASIAEVSRHTQSAAETARSAAQTARDGGTIVKEVLGSMHSIATAVSETSSTVGLLGDDSRRISQIVTVIDEIARKTNLLALNAAIEAARAGEQGRGFAVVAGEVRRLAESTAQATGEIASMIQGIQDRTRTAIASMESGTGTVQQGVVTTTQAGEALERIIGMAERVDKMITQIAIAASQQAVAADQSSASLDSIHSLSHDNLTEMATTAAGVESLRATAVALEQQVDRFNLQSTMHSMNKRSITPPTQHALHAA
jgi:methyl-accepting chemotaxis protein